MLFATGGRQEVLRVTAFVPNGRGANGEGPAELIKPGSLGPVTPSREVLRTPVSGVPDFRLGISL